TQDVLKTRTTEDWLQRLEAAGVPCAPVLTRQQVIAHPQIAASGILFESDHPTPRRLRQTRPPPRFQAPTRGPPGAPPPGEHNRDILCELGFASAAIDALKQAGVIGGEEAV